MKLLVRSALTSDILYIAISGHAGSQRERLRSQRSGAGGIGELSVRDGLTIARSVLGGLSRAIRAGGSTTVISGHPRK